MGLILQPYQMSNEFFMKALLYGQPGIGKSTLAISAPNSLLIDCDNGVHRIAANHRVPFLPVKSYDEVLEVLASKDIDGFETIVIDTAGKLLDYIASYIIKRDPKMGRKDGALTLQGYGVRKYEFINLLKRVSLLGKHLIFVAHETEERSGDDKVIRPEVGGSSGADLIKELDLVGYMEAMNRRRTISFSPCSKYYAKNSARLEDMIELPELKNGEANTLMSTIIEKCKLALKEESEQLKEYNRLLAEQESAIEAIKTVDDANAFFTGLKNFKQIWDSKIKVWAMMQAKASNLHLTFDTKGKCYVQNIAQSA